MLLTIELRNLSAHDIERLQEHTQQGGTKIAVQAVLEDCDAFNRTASLYVGDGFLRILNDDTTQRTCLRSESILASDSSLGFSGDSNSNSGLGELTPPASVLARANSDSLNSAARHPPGTPTAQPPPLPADFPPSNFSPGSSAA